MSDATKASEKLQLGKTAVDYAQRAVALAPNDPEAQLALAISYGKMLPMRGNQAADRHLASYQNRGG